LDRDGELCGPLCPEILDGSEAIEGELRTRAFRLVQEGHRIELRAVAVRALRKLDPPLARRVQAAIALLTQDPRPPASRPLRGRPAWRVRPGDYRMTHTIEDDVLLIVVITAPLGSELRSAR
jgi:mRNA interferase RelE/StbE